MGKNIVRVGINLNRLSKDVKGPSSYGEIKPFKNDSFNEDVKKIKSMNVEGDGSNMFNSGLIKRNQ
jgi:hypothetical protein